MYLVYRKYPPPPMRQIVWQPPKIIETNACWAIPTRSQSSRSTPRLPLSLSLSRLHLFPKLLLLCLDELVGVESVLEEFPRGLHRLGPRLGGRVKHPSREHALNRLDQPLVAGRPGSTGQPFQPVPFEKEGRVVLGLNGGRVLEKGRGAEEGGGCFFFLEFVE